MNLLIVEDEASSRDSMVSILQRHYPNYSVHSAADGEEALAKTELVHYDIVLADIQMPQMDGLTLLERIKQFAPDTKVIIISAYDYFYYAQRALQLGAVDYILKPFEEERILSAINRALDSAVGQAEGDIPMLEKEPGFLQDPDHSRQSAAPYLRDASWGRVSLLKEDLNPKELPRTVQEWQQLAAYIRRHLSETDRHYWIFAKNDNVGLIVLETFQEQLLDQLDKHLELLDRFIASLQRERRPRLYLSVGTLEPMHSISLSQIHAEESSRYKFYDRHSYVFWLPTLATTFTNTAIYTALQRHVQEGKPEEIRAQVQSAIKSAAWAHVMPRVFQEAMDTWIGNLILENRGFILAVDRVKLGELRSLALQQEHSEQYATLVSRLLGEISRLIGNFNSNKNAVLLEKCIEYIERNYANPDLSLQTITEHFYFNPSYFSTIFKKQTGKTIMQYLTMIRIQKAKELLRNTDLRINEVATRVGFSDMRYFMRVFKGETGVTPGTYRKQESEGIWN